ncbi:MAG TPA: winged helix-turn-helix domain-containing protein, partial [Vineibacter sp.]|nr:winged helix-turn-helix domain-containing protein [Vineibacter sp.]
MSEEGIVFGRWRLLPRTRLLVGDGERVALGGRAADVLLTLIEARGAVVTKEALMRRAWHGRFVEEGNLAVQISALRKAFGADGAEIVVTVPGVGYRLGGLSEPSLARPVAAVLGDTTVRPPTRGPSLAVLPMRTVGEGPPHVADGIVDDLITALSRIRWFYVLARNSAFSFKDRDLPAPEIGRELGVRYVVTGTLRHANGRVRVNVDLINTADGVPAWSERFDHALDDVFVLQDHIVGSIVAALEPGLRRAEIEQLRRRPTELPGAYQAWLRASACMHPMTRENCAMALSFLHEALAIDPGFAQAMAAIAWCRVWRVSQSFSDGAAAEAEEAIRLGEAALALAPDEPAVLAQVGMLFAYRVHRLDAAVVLARRAVEHHPNSALTRSAAGWVHLFADEPEVAIPHLEEALRLDPLDPSAGEPLACMSFAHLVAGRPDVAVRWGERAIAASPERLTAHR